MCIRSCFKQNKINWKLIFIDMSKYRQYFLSIYRHLRYATRRINDSTITYQHLHATWAYQWQHYNMPTSTRYMAYQWQHYNIPTSLICGRVCVRAELPMCCMWNIYWWHDSVLIVFVYLVLQSIYILFHFRLHFR